MKWNYPLRVETREEALWVWDMIRKKWVRLTPEEHVRQQTIHFMVKEKEVSPGLIGVEKGIAYHEMEKRFDLVVFDRTAQPFILCECKAPSVALSEETLRQAARYNMTLQAPHILITNGANWLFFSLDPKGTYQHQPSGWWE